MAGDMRQQLDTLVRRLTALAAVARAHLHAVVPPLSGGRLAVAGLAGASVLGVALSAASSPGLSVRPDIPGIVAVTGPDLSEDALLRLAGELDPAALSLARRHDPAAGPGRPWGLTPGWETLSLVGKPPLDPGAAAGLEAQRLNAALPAIRGALRPAQPFVFTPASEADARRALRCLTQAIYYEAALEPRPGQEAVAQVVLNRVRDPNFPNSICGVVYQGAERTTGCQFSFTCDGSLARAPVAWAWNRAESVARAALAGHVAAAVGTATHYHADYVRPWWSPTVTKVGQLGAHIFYRWTGGPGEPAAFRQTYAGREPVIDEARFARPRVATTAEAAAAAGVVTEARTVIVDGRERHVGVISLGGRRQPTREEMAEINARLEAYAARLQSGQPAAAEPRAAEPATDVATLDVVEVNRPQG